LGDFLAREGFELETASDAVEMDSALGRMRPDLILLDINMPGANGLQLLQRLRADADRQEIPVIFVTARISDADRIVGLELGADDYVTKPFNPHELVARVRAVLRRTQSNQNTTPAPKTILTHGDIRVDTHRYEVTVRDDIVNLTPTEFKLLRTLLEQPGAVFSRSELVEKALGYDFIALDRTLDNHIRNLRKKIERDPANPDYITTVYGVGYRLESH
ncbi:MAG: response regulator transcription factor, partial [Chloroflexota bacterium]